MKTMQLSTIHIEKDTIENKNYRKVIFTGCHLQIVLMSLKPGEEIGMETHPYVDQFFRIEEGKAIFIADGKEYNAKNGDAFVVPSGTEHNMINASKESPLKLYTIYAPPNHPANRLQKEKPRETDCRCP